MVKAKTRISDPQITQITQILRGSEEVIHSNFFCGIALSVPAKHNSFNLCNLRNLRIFMSSGSGLNQRIPVTPETASEVVARLCPSS
jgi:hypothetical protein